MPTVKAPTKQAAPAKKPRGTRVQRAAPTKKSKSATPAAPAVGKPAKAPITTQPVPKPPAADKRAKAAKPPKKAPKVRPRMVRDSFTMPEADFALVGELKARALGGQRETKKSELLRAGLHALAALDKASLLRALGQLEPVKVGRPKKGHGQT